MSIIVVYFLAIAVVHLLRLNRVTCKPEAEITPSPPTNTTNIA